jgi:hypothetical protein
MANATATDFLKKQLHMAEYGNGISEDYGPVNANGVLQNEKIYLGIIPAGTRVQDVRIITSGTLNAGTTINVGYEPVDTAPAAVLTYWQSGLASTSALNAISAGLPITFDKAVKLVVQVLGANVSGSPTVAAVVQGKAVGAP